LPDSTERIQVRIAIGDDATQHVWGGRLCIAVVNTVWWRRSQHPRDELDRYSRLVRLAGDSGFLPHPDILATEGERNPTGADVAVSRAKELREDLHRLFAASVQGGGLDPLSLTRLDEVAGRALTEVTLSAHSGTVEMVWRTDRDLMLPVWLISLSAVDLLTSGFMDRVKACAGEGCGWLFLDQTKNGSRRWCHGSTCGNRARAKAHYHRSRAASVSK
jgi:predicted RNA-binding Zn ribbon-like protein